MLKSSFVFPAIFNYSYDGISVKFPDLPGCFACGNNEEEAYIMAKDALGCHLRGMELDHFEIPNRTPINKIDIKENQVLVLVEVWMPLYRNKDNKTIKKTLTLPKWLNDLGEEKGVNFSQVLQSGLKDYFGIKREIKATGDIRDWTAWIWEKSENTVKDLARMIDVLNKQPDLDQEFKEYLMSRIHTALWDSLKILAFSCGAEWTVDDVKLIDEQGSIGVDIILERYDTK